MKQRKQFEQKILSKESWVSSELLTYTKTLYPKKKPSYHKEIFSAFLSDMETLGIVSCEYTNEGIVTLVTVKKKPIYQINYDFIVRPVHFDNKSLESIQGYPKPFLPY